MAQTTSLWRHAPGGLGSGIAVLESASWHVGVGLSDCRTAGNILYVPPGNFDDICMSPLGNVTPGNESSALPAAVFWVASVSLLVTPLCRTAVVMSALSVSVGP